jgi:hypothetical protein
MKFYTIDETTYPGIPDYVGPETRLTNRFCNPELAAQTYGEHLDEWALCEDLGLTAPWSMSTISPTSTSTPPAPSWPLRSSCEPSV